MRPLFNEQTRHGDRGRNDLVYPGKEPLRRLPLLLTLLPLLLTAGSARAVNGDPDLDAVFGNYAQRNRACLGNGAGGFTCIDVSTDTNSTYAVALSVCADGSTPPCIATAGVPDSDGDGVPDRLDVCSDTVIPEGVPTKGLGVNRWALLDGDGIFDTTLPPGGGKSPQLAYTIEETAGCSCEQIITALDLGKGHEKFGCSISAMETFLEFVNP